MATKAANCARTYDEGFEDGYRAGVEDGYGKGYDSGFSEGWAECRRSFEEGNL
jgi:flagellar biosynthesis/type III secretory pathway protein FliH